MNHKPKIMATLTPERATRETIRTLHALGMEGIRINSAHATIDDMATIARIARDVSPEISLLMDTKGPELRTTSSNAPISLYEGLQTAFIYAPEETSTAARIGLQAPGLDSCVSKGDTLLLDDGLIAARVENVSDGMIYAEITRGGILDSCKTVAIEGGELPELPAVSPRDRQAIEAALETGFDMIAHSFVRSASDVEAVRELIDGSNISLYAKIECRSAVARLDEIALAADGLLIARGDMGTAFPLWEIPGLQAKISAKCRADNLPFILSTQVMQSMIDHPTPTRAELSDVALACAQGAAWILLCGETAVGRYPAECVDYLHKTIEACTCLTL